MVDYFSDRENGPRVRTEQVIWRSIFGCFAAGASACRASGAISCSIQTALILFSLGSMGVIFSCFAIFPPLTPPALSRPAGRKRGASCGRVFERKKYTCHGALRDCVCLFRF